jgi:hypothetical protein
MENGGLPCLDVQIVTHDIDEESFTLPRFLLFIHAISSYVVQFGRICNKDLLIALKTQSIYVVHIAKWIEKVFNSTTFCQFSQP